MLLVLGAVSVFIALTRGHDSLFWQIFLLILGLAVLYQAEMMRRATALSLELYPDVLRDSAGQELARIDDIKELDRGTFSIKPSNGFTIVTHTSGQRSWAPGLWWRLGRRVGVGGVTSAPHCKAMAEMIEAMLRERDQADETG